MPADPASDAASDASSAPDAASDESPQPTVHVGSHGVEPGEPSGSLRVVSWNIQFGLEADAAAAALLTVEELRSADIVLLQEMDEAGTQLIARAIGANHVFAALGPHRQTGRSFGNAVLSRWPLSDPSAVALSHRAAVQGQERLAVSGSVTIGATPIAASSVHIEVPTLSPPKRRRQFAEAARASERWRHHRLVVGGDFNTLTRRGVSAVDREMEAIGATRVSSAMERTLRRGGREFPLDHVYARGLHPIESGVVRGISASDHRPVWVDLEL